MTTPIFEIETALEAVLYAAERLKSKDFHKVFKVLYFADREHFAKYGRPITGDTYIKMENGPVPSKIYDIVKAIRDTGEYTYTSYYGGGYGGERRCSQMLAVRNGKFITPLRNVDERFLAQSDVTELEASIGEYGNLSFGELSRRSHALAWKNADKNGKMSAENILREAGKSDDYIGYVCEQINAARELC
ncbi:MAG: SocA family protein [Prevotellaceae bacterium]|jgi:uncharacterized phage-associated protein|nr:SocA family protein [Prevotellaceae bacterium]